VQTVDEMYDIMYFLFILSVKIGISCNTRRASNRIFFVRYGRAKFYLGAHNFILIMSNDRLPLDLDVIHHVLLSLLMNRC
jgi:hypothetical protein